MANNYDTASTAVNINDSTANNIQIRIAETQEVTRWINPFVQMRYEMRGYVGQHRIVPDDKTITLVAFWQGELTATLTLRFDSDNGLLADDIFKSDLDTYRAQGKRLCEVIKFAVSKRSPSQVIMAALFSHAFNIGRLQSDIAVIEVNPRHKSFYTKMLGFRTNGDGVKMNRRVAAPACLLTADLISFDTRGAIFPVSSRDSGASLLCAA